MLDRLTHSSAGQRSVGNTATRPWDTSTARSDRTCHMGEPVRHEGAIPLTFCTECRTYTCDWSYHVSRVCEGRAA